MGSRWLTSSSSFTKFSPLSIHCVAKTVRTHVRKSDRSLGSSTVLSAGDVELCGEDDVGEVRALTQFGPPSLFRRHRGVVGRFEFYRGGSAEGGLWAPPLIVAFDPGLYRQG